jgi:hypothetical protein
MSDAFFPGGLRGDTNLSIDDLRLNTAVSYSGVGRSVMLGLINRRLVKIKMKRLPDARGVTRRVILVSRKSIDDFFESLADGRIATWRE